MQSGVWRVLLLLLGVVLPVLAQPQPVTTHRTAEFFTHSREWRSLFNGQDLRDWRFLHDQPIDERFWQVEDGLVRTLPGGQWGADIITRDTFDNFAFCADWRLEKGGNSGILYNVREDQWRGQDSVPGRVRRAWMWLIGGTVLAILLLFLRRGFLRQELARGLIVGIYAVLLAHYLGPFERLLAYAHYMENWKAAGLEMQIFDDSHFAGRTMEPDHGNGSLYDIFAPTSREGGPAGTWNTSCVVVDGKQVEQWVNGTRVLAYALESAEFQRAVARSRYRSIRGITSKAPMRIALQNHDGQLTWFRNLRIRVLPK